MYVVFALMLLAAFAITRALLLRATKMPGLATATGVAFALALLAGALLRPIMFGRHDAASVAPATGLDSTPAAVAVAPSDAAAPAGVATKPVLVHLDPKRLAQLTVGADIGSGSIDSLSTAGAAPGGTFPAGKPLVVSGWAADPGSHGPAAGVILIVDGRKRIDATASYGVPRPDVAKFFGNGAMQDTGFQGVTIATAGLSRGSHTLDLGDLATTGRSYYPVKEHWTFRLQ